MHDLVIVGAGAAGLAAARTAIDRGLDVRVLEASHRIGGRAYSEEIAPGVAFDLGCHWLHSASINPFVGIAERLGVEFRRGMGWTPRVHLGSRWATEAEYADFFAYWDACNQSVDACHAARHDGAVAEVIERDSPWTPWFDYWTSLMTSSDSDRVSAADMASYRDTGENWPVVGGYGNLVRRYGDGLPVTLNAAVERVRLTPSGARIDSAAGTVDARTVLVTVSTGILASGRIAFDPPLPADKQEAISAVPLGNHNRIAVALDGDPLGVEPSTSVIDLDGDVPMLLHLRPYDQDYVVGVTGGRFADWLERAGTDAATEHLMDRLVRLFGAGVRQAARGRIVTAWGSDPWTLGAYSTCLPGQAHQRAVLARAVDERLYFAGEATSPDAFATCHGAYQTGVDTATAIADALAA